MSDRCKYIRTNGTTHWCSLAAAPVDQKPIAKTVLSCGCRSNYGGIPAEWDTTDRKGNAVVAFGVICERHWHSFAARHPWVGLTEEDWKILYDRYAVYQEYGAEDSGWFDFARAVEAWLREKNT